MVIVILGCVLWNDFLSCVLFFLSKDLQIKFTVSYDTTNLLHYMRFITALSENVSTSMSFKSASCMSHCIYRKILMPSQYYTFIP